MVETMMQVRRRALMAGATFLLAAATGHVMQSGDTISARLRGMAMIQEGITPVPAETAVTPLQASLQTETAPGQADATTAAMAAPSALPELPDLPAAQPMALSAGVLLSARLDRLDSYRRPVSDADARYDGFGFPCVSPTLTLGRAEPALVTLAVSAPCHPLEPVTIRHAGLVVTMLTDAAGLIDTALPALSRDARISIAFADGEAAEAAQTVTGLERLRRVAVQWRGRPGLRLNAYENGAEHGAEGHVLAAAPRGPANAEGGFLMVLGDPSITAPMLAEVYTLPTAPASRPVTAELVVEAEVTASACGRILHGEAIYARADAEPRREPLRLAMPGCDAMGDFVMLALPDLPGPDLPEPVNVAAAGQ
jgi:hypothetical protein